MPLNQAVTLRQSQTRFHSLFVSFDTSHKALKLADLADSHVLKPGVELFPLQLFSGGDRTESLAGESVVQGNCHASTSMKRSHDLLPPGQRGLFAQGHNLLVLSQMLFSLRLTLLCTLRILFRRHFALHGRERSRS